MTGGPTPETPNDAALWKAFSDDYHRRRVRRSARTWLAIMCVMVVSAIWGSASVLALIGTSPTRWFSICSSFAACIAALFAAVAAYGQYRAECEWLRRPR